LINWVNNLYKIVIPKKNGKAVKMMKLSQIRLMVKDFNKSVAFYKDVMEFPMVMSEEKMQYASFNTGEIKLELLSRKSMAEVLGEKELPTNADSQSKFLLDVAVDDVDKIYNSLMEKGAESVTEPHDRKEWNARVAHFRDPDGNVIEIYKHPLKDS
jgi:lactoylglutathione lyase